MTKKMIFRDEFTGEQSEIYKKPKFKEFKVPTDFKYTERSLQLIYEMYCRWLNTRYGAYLFKFNLSIEDDNGEYGETLIDYLFHTVQGYVEKRNTGSDKSIGMIWNTKRKDSSTVHEGFFVIPMTETEMIKSPRGDEAKIPDDVHSVFSRIFTNFSDKVENGIISGHKIALTFLWSKYGEDFRAVFSNSSFKMQEWCFITLCEIAELPKDEPCIAPVLFRTRLGYNPHHSYLSTQASMPF